MSFSSLFFPVYSVVPWIPPEVQKTRNAVYECNTIEKWTKACILFSKKGDLVITKNYGGITLTVIAAKIYHALLFNCIPSKVKKILCKNQNSF